MLLDIFSGFDDHHKVVMGLFPVVWLVVLVGGPSLGVHFWSKCGSMGGGIGGLLSVVRDLVVRTQMKHIGGSYSIFSALLFSLVVFNLFGLFSYVFSVTSHLAVNLALALPLWGCTVLLGAFYNLGSFLAHLQPLGSPAFLSPFLSLVELVSLLVRPITLAVRLTANLSTGHILMSLLGVGFVSSNWGVGLAVILVGTGYCLFEMVICFVQGYIFTLLPTLYGDEHPSEG